MIALFFEVYGAFCFLSLIAFVLWSATAKLRPDLDEERFHIGELEEFTKLASFEPVGNALPVESPLVAILSRSAPPRPIKHSKRPIQRRPHLIHTRNPHRPHQAA